MITKIRSSTAGSLDLSDGAALMIGGFGLADRIRYESRRGQGDRKMDGGDCVLEHPNDSKRDLKMTRMLIMGPPGSGKGTQAERISECLGIVAISTGDIFRANVKGETPLGLEAKNYIDAGDFVPDWVTNNMVQDRLKGSDVENGFLLDGYPRTAAQINHLDKILVSKGQGLDVVLELTADREELVARLLGRAKASGRSDDNEDVIRHRLDLYHEQTEAVVSEYARRGVPTRVDGIGAMDTVTDRLFHAIRTRDAIAPGPSPIYAAAGISGSFQGM